MLMTLDNFWTLLSSKSPFLMVSWYCQFLLSGLGRRGKHLSPGFGYRVNSRSTVWRTVVLPIGFHNLVHFVNFTVKTASSDESGQFPEEGEGWWCSDQEEHRLQKKRGMPTLVEDLFSLTCEKPDTSLSSWLSYQQDWIGLVAIISQPTVAKYSY